MAVEFHNPPLCESCIFDKIALQRVVMTLDARRPTIRPYSGGADIRSMEEALRQLRSAFSELGLPPLDAQPVAVTAFPMRLPNGEATTSIALIVPVGTTGHSIAFVLPCSARFSAKATLGERRVFDAQRIHGAKVEPDQGDMQLADGTYLHDVALVATKNSTALTPRQAEIVRNVVISMNAQEECFRAVLPLGAGNDGNGKSFLARPQQQPSGRSVANYQAMHWLDFAAIRNVKLPASLKEIERRVIKIMPDVSRSALTDAIAAAGMRKPRSGPRSDRSFAIRQP